MKKALLFLSIAVLAIACKPEVKITPEVQLNTPAEVNVVNEGDNVTVEFTSNVAWTASLGSCNWATLNTASGEAGTAKVKISVLKNDTEDNRTATLTITAETASAKVNITQLQKNALSLSDYSGSVEADECEVVVKVLSNVQFEAKANDEWLSVVSTKGVTESTVTIKVEANKGEERSGSVTISGEGLSADVAITQAAFVPFFEIEMPESGLSVGVAGGEATFSINTNCDYTMKKYDGADQAFPWAPVTVDGNTVKFTAEASKEYAPRAAYVKFTVPAIQDPVLDANGEPTGETEDHVERVYLSQDGNMTTTWSIAIPEALNDMSGAAAYRLALSNGMLFVSTGGSIHVYNAATGEYVSKLNLGSVTATGICNDDAGNCLISVNGEWGSWFAVKLITAADVAAQNLANMKTLIYCNNNVYGYGFNNIQAVGDCTAKGVVTAFSAGYSEGDPASYYVAWDVNSGYSASWVQDDNGTWVSNPKITKVIPMTTASIWNSNNGFVHPAGKSVNDGFFFNAYVGDYNLYYCADYTANEWSMIYASGSSWAEGYNAFDLVEWNGKKVAAMLGMAYFPYWGMPTYCHLLDVTNPAETTALGVTEIYGDGLQYGQTDDVVLNVAADGSLNSYVIDGMQGVIACYNYPVL